MSATIEETALANHQAVAKMGILSDILEIDFKQLEEAIYD